VSGDVIVTVTLNAALHVAYSTGEAALLAPTSPPEDVTPISRPGYRAGGRGVTVARVLRSFGHDVLAAGLAGGASGELIIQDLAQSGVPTAFTLIRGESRRFFRFAGPDTPIQQYAEPGPYITTEELGRFAADYRRLLAGAAAVVLCGSLPDGLPADTYGSLVTYAAEAGVPVILDAGGEELKHAVGHGPDLVVAESSAVEPGTGGFGADLIRLGAGAAAVAAGGRVHVVTADGEWTARLEADAGASSAPARGALVAGLVPGQLLGWSWPDRLRHALALAAGPDEREARGHVDLAAYERLLEAVRVEPSAPGYFKELLSDHSECARVWIRLTNSPPNLGPVDFQTPSWNGFAVNSTSRVMFSAITTSKWSASCTTGEFCSGVPLPRPSWRWASPPPRSRRRRTPRSR
jgi:tagatose 6-phosphate kinase